jgi:quercetin dioxygenase-like cupin family protein
MTKVTAAAQNSVYKGNRGSNDMSENYTAIPNILEAIAVPEKGILSHTVHNDTNVKIIVFGFAPGQELTAHTAPMPAMIQILRGDAEITLGDDSLLVSAGCVIHMQPNLPHGIVAKTPLLMLLTLIKAARIDSGAKAA